MKVYVLKHLKLDPWTGRTNWENVRIVTDIFEAETWAKQSLVDYAYDELELEKPNEYEQALNDVSNAAKEHGLISTEFSYSALLAYEDKKITEDELWECIGKYTQIDLESIIRDLLEDYKSHDDCPSCWKECEYAKSNSELIHDLIQKDIDKVSLLKLIKRLYDAYVVSYRYKEDENIATETEKLLNDNAHLLKVRT